MCHTPPAQPLPFTSSNKYSLLREHYLDGDGDGEARDHFSDENSMDNADELSGFYSPAARADAEYEADIAARTQQVECAHLEQDNRYSVLEQDFPPLQASHNSHPQSPSQPVDKALRINAQSSSDNSRNQQICSSSNNSSNAISDYVSSPIQTRAQRLKNGNSVLPLHKQKKQTKADKREANALARLSKSTTTHNESSDPDEFQWNVLLKDHLKRKEAAAANMISVTDSYGQVASMVKDAVSLEQAQQIKKPCYATQAMMILLLIMMPPKIWTMANLSRALQFRNVLMLESLITNFMMRIFEFLSQFCCFTVLLLAACCRFIFCLGNSLFWYAIPVACCSFAKAAAATSTADRKPSISAEFK